ncbi:hypothetical protein QE410_003239 [Microbacterium sp. SORGH_AS 1204]|uniref:hypothetical protein n=1 Tax=Microbacterium sp. SORGH_AS_1204 TaxID=3041785 RepID=UPI0027914D2C|nr:hypothetical protein [Microbacterium sp. SORGH_AS_1204]MDQ1138440.1 hypothetical protein [Microbacterium sp. SORGH_AS_1204]
MALYLAPDLIRHAVDRLRASRAQTRLLEYLIFRRALELSGGASAQVATGKTQPLFQQAIREWAQVRPADQPQAFFNPFGTVRAQDGGFRSGDFPSNGASDTVGRWGGSMSSPPFKRLPDVRPMTFVYSPSSAPDLERSFLQATSTDPDRNSKPRLADTAVWWLRERDLETLGFTEQVELSDLVGTLRTENGLTDVEQSALFDSSLI